MFLLSRYRQIKLFAAIYVQAGFNSGVYNTNYEHLLPDV